MRYLILIFLLSSCYSSKRAVQDIVKAQSAYPDKVAEACSNYYPTKDSVIRETEYIKGETDTLINYVELDCDTVTEVKYKNRIIRVKQPVKTRVDTFIKKVFKSIERTDKLRAKDTLLQREKANSIKQRTLKRHHIKRSNKYATAFYGLVSLLLLVLVGRFYLKRIRG